LPTLASRRIAASIAATLGVLVAAGSLALPASARPLRTTFFSYGEMPDFDQRRAAGTDGAGMTHRGLPGDGKMYCAPTAAMDAIAFLADHGSPELAPGKEDWSKPANYETGTFYIRRMGQFMGTDAATGTSQAGFETGLDTWSRSYGKPFGFVSKFSDAADPSAPDLDVARKALAAGNPVLLRVGYYRPVEKTVGGRTIQVMEQLGAHWVVMTGYDDSGLNFIDPDDTTDRFAPSDFTNIAQPVAPVTGVYGWTTDDGVFHPYIAPVGGVPGAQTFVHMQGSYGGGNAYVEGFTVLRPNFTVTARLDGIRYTQGDEVHRVTPPRPGARVSDLQVSPMGDAAYYSLEGSRTIYKLDLDTGESRPLASAPAPVTSLAVDTEGERVFAAAGPTVAAVSSTGEPVATTTLDSDVASVAYDHESGTLDAVTPGDGQVTEMEPDLEPQAVTPLPEQPAAAETAADAPPAGDGAPTASMSSRHIRVRPIVRRSQNIRATGVMARVRG
jgi:hypothetical protein